MAAGAETELERMVVRLIGDASQYLQALQQSVAATQSSAAQIQQAHRQTEQAHAAKSESIQHHTDQESESLGELTHHVLELVEAYVGLEAVKHLIEMYDKWEETLISLNATLEAHGRNVEELTDIYMGFAAAEAQVSFSTRGATLDLIRQAEEFGLTGEAATKAVKNAIALSEANHRSASSMLNFIQAMEQGNKQQALAFARQLPALRRIRDDTELSTKFVDQLWAALKREADMAETWSKGVDNLSKAWKDFAIQLGKDLATVFKPLLDWLTALVQILEKTPAWVKAVVASFIIMGMFFVVLTGVVHLLRRALFVAKEEALALQGALSGGPAGAIIATLIGVGTTVAATAVTLQMQANAAAEGKEAMEKLTGAQKEGEAQDYKNKLAAGELRDAIKKHVEELEKEIPLIRLQAWEKERATLKSLGATDAMLKEQGVTRLEQAKLREEIGKATDELEKQAKTFNFTEEALKRYDFVLQGTTELQLAAYDAAVKHKEAMKEAQKDFDEATKTIKENMTPARKAAEAQELLRYQFRQGAIDAETFARAMMKLNSQHQVAAGFQAVLGGSAEAVARVEEAQQKREMAMAVGLEARQTGPGSTERTNDILMKIKELLDQQAHRVPVVMAKAVLSGV